VCLEIISHITKPVNEPGPRKNIPKVTSSIYGVRGEPSDELPGFSTECPVVLDKSVKGRCGTPPHVSPHLSVCRGNPVTGIDTKGSRLHSHLPRVFLSDRVFTKGYFPEHGTFVQLLKELNPLFHRFVELEKVLEILYERH
jgi:hypothetical protein